MSNDDAQEIRRRLDAQIEQVLDRYYSGWMRRGNKAYLTPKNPKDLGSFQVNLTGARRGQWYRFSQEVGGGSVELLSYALTGGPKAYDIAFREARGFLGMSNERSRADDPEIRERREEEQRRSDERRREQQKKEAARRARRAATAEEIWNERCPLKGSLAEIYLTQHRKIAEPPDGWPESLAYHEGLEWEPGAVREEGGRKIEAGPVFPALVARLQDVAGQTVAVHQIFLAPNGKKAAVDPNKVTLGPMIGAAVRIGGIGPTINVCEGLETAFGIRKLLNFTQPVWAGVSTSGVAGMEFPLGVNRIRDWPDGDLPMRRKDGEYIAVEHGPGKAAALKLGERVRQAGMQFVIQEAPWGGDFDDVAQAVRVVEEQ